MLEPGEHDLGGLRAEAGVLSVGGDWQTVEFLTAFDDIPVVLAQVINEKGDVAATVRMRGVSKNGFSLLIQQQELTPDVVGNRAVHYMAFEQGEGSFGDADNEIQLQVGLTERVVSQTPYTINFMNEYLNPTIYAHVQSYFGGDPTALGLDELSPMSATVKLMEERSANFETSHIAEVVGWVVVGDTE